MSRTAHKLMASGAKKAFEIDQSLMFEVADTSYLKRDYGSGASSSTKWTFSTWIKNTSENYAGAGIWTSWDGSTQSDTSYGWMGFYQDRLQFGGWSTTWRDTNRLFRDVGAWMHLVVAVDTTLGTADNRIRIYINGVEETSFATKNNPAQNTELPWNKQQQHRLGGIVPAPSGTSYYFGGYLAETQVIDGSQLTPSSFGETDSETGQWIPKKYAGTYPGYSFYFPFSKNDRYSPYFDGSASTGIQIADNTDFTLGTNSFTVEAWVYRDDDAGNTGYICGQSPSDGATNQSSFSLSINSSNQPAAVVATPSGDAGYIQFTSSTAVVDSTWNHVALVRNGNAFAIYLNGTSVATETMSFAVRDSSEVFGIGKLGAYTAGHFKGWISNFRFVNGTAVYTSNFTPSTSPLTAITNTKLLCCQDATITTDNSGTSKTLTVTAANTYTQQMAPFTYDWYQDQSGQDNHFTADNLTVNDVMLDTPTNNYPTINSLEPYNSTLSTLAQGNLHAYATTYDSHYYGNHTATFLVPESGKWYIETRMAVYNGTGNTSWIGVIDQRTATIPKRYGHGATAGEYFSDSAFTGMTADLIATVDTIRLFRGGSAQATVSSATETSYIIALALDVDNNKVYGGYDSGSGITWLGSGNPAAGSNGQAHTFTNDTVIQLEVGPKSDGSSNSMQTLNFGQNGTFSGYETAGGNTDGNGEGNFFYAPPSGFLALCSKNLPDPAIKDPSAHFQTTLYAGDSSNSTVITNSGNSDLQPDLIWIKNRTHGSTTGVGAHMLFDVARGIKSTTGSDSPYLSTNNNDVETTNANALLAVSSDGFTPGSMTRTNETGDNLVAWQWKAGGGAGSSNTDGTINTISTSVNTTAGISISAYTGTGSTGTIGHGLGVAPSVIIVKNTDTNDNWRVQTISDATDYMALNWTGASTDDASSWNDTAATSSVFTVGNDTNTNRSGDKFVAYCFADVEGFSKSNWFRGNASANGTFVNLGFRPAYIMLKMRSVAITNGGDWIVRDVKRDVDNPSNSAIYTNLHAAESTTSLLVDIVSNGFKIRSNHDDHNKADETMWWMAFAEFPLKYANAR